MALGLLLVIVSAILCGVSGLLYFIGVDDPSVPPALLAFGAASGFVGVKIP